MRYGLILLSVLLCTALTTQAAAPTEQSVSEMMSIMQLETLLKQALAQMTDGMTKAMEAGLKKAAEGKELSAAQKAKIESFRADFTSTMNEQLNMAKVKAIYVQAYKETFTQDEVNGVIAFYKSPGGKAILEKNPDAMKKANALMDANITPMGQKLQGMLEQFIKDFATAK